jgi:hypothetical protein
MTKCAQLLSGNSFASSSSSSSSSSSFSSSFLQHAAS